MKNSENAPTNTSNQFEEDWGDRWVRGALKKAAEEARREKMQREARE